MGTIESPYEPVRHIPLYYDNSDSLSSALALILTLRPEWRESKDTVEFVRFTDGITNTVCPRLLRPLRVACQQNMIECTN
jgi:ethanolamine kinase